MRHSQPVPARPRPPVLALIGAILLLALLGLGVLARTTAVTGVDLRIDEAVQHLRFPAATGLFLGVTDAASEIAGIGLLLAGVIVLLVRRRRWDALRLVAMAGSAWVLAIGVKILVARPRPPAALWALVPDPSGSFPSGHDTTACVVVVVAFMAFAGARRARAVAVTLAVLFAVVVGVSRVYLGDHYPTDVIGSWLAVGAAALLVAALSDVASVRRVGATVVRDRRALETPVLAHR